MTAAEVDQVAGGVAIKSAMDAVGGTLQGQRAAAKEARVESQGPQGEGWLPWSPPTPSPCGGEHHICRPTI